MEWSPNEKQQKVIDFLKSMGGAFTLAQISFNLGIEIKSGTTNTLVKKGLIKCNKDAYESVCPCCGHKTKVSTYEIA